MNKLLNIPYHCYADDTLLYFTLRLSEAHHLQYLLNCVVDVQCWMTKYFFLQLSESTKEVFIIGHANSTIGLVNSPGSPFWEIWVSSLILLEKFDKLFFSYFYFSTAKNNLVFFFKKSVQVHTYTYIYTLTLTT